MPEAQGLFETIRTRGGRPTLWRRHYERLARSAHQLGFPTPPAAGALEAAVVEALETSGLSEAVVRITLVRDVSQGGGPAAGFRVEAEPLSARIWAGARAGAASAIFSSQPFEPGPLAGHKITDRRPYAPAREEARARGADEALLVSPRGVVLEGTVSNVFAVIDGGVLTPPVSAGILPGVLRGLVLEACRTHGFRAQEGDIRRERLVSADEVFLTNAVQRVVPVAFLEGQPIPDRAIGLELMQICDMMADVGSEG